MKKRLPVILVILLFIIGIGVMLYPFIANEINNMNQAEIIENYDDTVAEMNAEKLQAEKEAAYQYNESLHENVILTDPFDPNANKASSEEYEARLNIGGDGIMGYVEIPTINVKLGIRHGTSYEVLTKGAGHLENTSLPVGGLGTHAVISAHTAYPTAKFFDNLTSLKEGDVFYLTVLDEKLAYQVDQIKVVNPDDTGDLAIDWEQDYVTLVTCTPYGVNSHRLLVRGTRVPYVEEEVEQIAAASNQWIIYLIIAAAILALIIAIVIVRKRRKRRRERHEA